jgi:sulfatase maturation enzyme AslB (radical SAM superfamily)
MVKCFATTNSVSILSPGTVSPCCKYRGDFGHLDTYQNFSDINFNELTDQLSNGWVPGCSSCEQHESNNIRSRRKSYEIRFTDNDFLLDVSLGNYCNLKCRMCSHDNSTSWYTDSISLGVPKHKLSGFQLSKKQIDSLMNFLTTINKHIEIELKGGEPLLHKNSQYFFEQLNLLSKTKNITLSCVTNGTLLPVWFENSVKNIDINLQISIDGLYDVYEYIRGGNTQSWEDCINKVEQFKKLKNIKLSYNYVVQNSTVHQVAEFSRLFGEHINWIVLNRPNHMAANIMPEDSKKQIIDELKLLDNSTINTIIELIKLPVDNSLYTKFITYSAKLDKLRNQDLRKVLPHLLNKDGLKIYNSV